MVRTRAERRHHNVRLKKIRSKYRNAGYGSERQIGICLHSPCGCSCWMCGHQRAHHGPRVQEIRARARYTD